MTESAKRTFLVVFAVIFSVGLLEAGIRLMSWANGMVSGGPHYREIATAAATAEISADTFNIFYFGGSTMQGYPYQNVVSIPEIISWLLDGELANKPVRFVNFGVSGADIGHNLDRLRAVVDHYDEFRPALFVIYSGHNEFLRFNRRFSSPSMPALLKASKLAEVVLSRFQEFDLTIDDRELIDAMLVSRQAHKSVIQEYNRSLETMLDISQEHHIPVLLSTVASNYSEWSPNRSSFCPDESRHDELRHLVAEGARLELEGNLEFAMGMYDSAISLCPRFAEAHFALGRVQLSTGSMDDAWKSFQSAIDSDGMPFRATSMQNDFILNQEPHPGLIIVDSVDHLRRSSTDGALGYDLMIDAHHPNLEGYLDISELFTAEIVQHFDAGRDARTYSVDELISHFGFTQLNDFNTLVANGRWMTRIATWRFDPDARLARADLLFQQAAEIDPKSYKPPLGRAMVAFLQLRTADAEAFLEAANRHDDSSVKEYLRTPWINSVIRRAYEIGGSGS